MAFARHWLGSSGLHLIIELQTDGGYSDSELKSLNRLLQQVPPVYPSLESRVILENSKCLQDLLKADSSHLNHIVHFRCQQGVTELIAEQCRNFLDQKKEKWQLMTYFRFNSHDFRFSSLRQMCSSTLAYAAYNRIASHNYKGYTANIGNE